MFTDRRATLVATLLHMAGGPVLLPMSAQVDPGVRVRITTAPSGQPKIGTLVSADADTLRFTSSGSGSVQSIPTASVVRFERSRGRRSNAGRGAVIGGALITVFVGGVGAGIGALLGATSKRDRWESAPIPGQPVSQDSAEVGRAVGSERHRSWPIAAR